MTLLVRAEKANRIQNLILLSPGQTKLEKICINKILVH